MNNNFMFTYHELVTLFTLCNDCKKSNQNIINVYDSFISDDSDEMEIVSNTVDISKSDIAEMNRIIRKINKMLDGGFYNG